MRNPFKSLVLAAVLMLAGIAASAQVTTSSLGGRVVDQNGEPVIGAAVVAVHLCFKLCCIQFVCSCVFSVGSGTPSRPGPKA